MSRRGLEFCKSRFFLKNKVKVLIAILFKSFPMMLVEELFGKVICVRGTLILSDGVLTLVQGRFNEFYGL